MNETRTGVPQLDQPPSLRTALRSLLGAEDCIRARDTLHLDELRRSRPAIF